MPLTIQDSRILIKTSTTTGEVPETAPSNDHTDGTWNTLDIYKGELFINTADDKIWMRSDSGIIRLFTYTTDGNNIVLSTGDVISDASDTNFLNLNANEAILDADGASYVKAYHNAGINSFASLESGGVLVRANGILTRIDMYAASGIRLGLGSTHNANLLLYNAVNNNHVNIICGTTSASYTLTLPTAQASGTQVLQNDGAGVLSWATVTGDVTASNTVTLTNKRITKRTVTVNAPGATPTINSDNCDIAAFTGLAANITSMTTNLSGTPVSGDLLSIELTDNGVARTIAWGASFAASGYLALPTTTAISTLLRSLFQWNATTSKWEIIAIA